MSIVTMFLKMKKYCLNAIMLAALATFAGACAKPGKTKEQVMQERLAERLDRWKADMSKRCLKEVVEQATAITDSTLIANAKLNRDTSILRLIPDRPARPDYVPPTDSVPVKPVLQ
jgi:hypothetical protein